MPICSERWGIWWLTVQRPNAVLASGTRGRPAAWSGTTIGHRQADCGRCTCRRISSTPPLRLTGRQPDTRMPGPTARSALWSWGRPGPAAARRARTAAAGLRQGARGPRRLPRARCVLDATGPTPPCPCRPRHQAAMQYRPTQRAKRTGRASRRLDERHLPLVTGGTSCAELGCHHPGRPSVPSWRSGGSEMARSLQELWAEEDAAQLARPRANPDRPRRRASHRRRPRRRLVVHGTDRTRT
jgi:hypothetical protein